ncbi:MAG: AEC family transporter [Clostridia bacterium]|nr:AEC family transporter [Clostridia bacterium]
MSDTLKIGLLVGKNVALNVIVLFVLMLIGFLLAKKKMLDKTGIKQLTNILLYVVIPCVIINAYQIDFDVLMLKNLGIAIAFAIALHFLGILTVPFLFKPDGQKHNRINVFSVIYSNCGFMGLPLVQAAFGSEGVFYVVAYITVFNIMYWTHGSYLCTMDIKQLSFKKAVINPGVLGTLMGLMLFLMRIKLPPIVSDTVKYMAALNTPLPMIILGAYLVDLDIRKVIKCGSIWAVCVLRLLIFPVVAILIAKIFGIPDFVKMPVIIASACPVAVVAALFATKYKLDSKYSSEIVSMSNLLSIITLPLITVIGTIV